MIIKTITVPFECGEKFDVWPFADLHYDSATCDDRAFRRDLSAMSDKAIAFGGGDWFSSISVTDKRYSHTDHRDRTEPFVNNAIAEVAGIMMPYRNRFVGLGIGNHERSYVKRYGVDPVGLLCERMSDNEHVVSQLGYSSVIRIRFEYTKGGCVNIYTIRRHHGWGGASRTEGGNVTKFAREAKNWDVDLAVYSHVHDPDMKTLPPILSVGRDGKLVARKRMLVITGTYQKTYNDDVYPTYAEEMGFPPTEIGTTPIILTVNKDGVKTSYGGSV